MFDLEKAIKGWIKSLHKYEVFKGGLIADLELHLFRTGKSLSSPPEILRLHGLYPRYPIRQEMMKSSNRLEISMIFNN